MAVAVAVADGRDPDTLHRTGEGPGEPPRQGTGIGGGIRWDHTELSRRADEAGCGGAGTERVGSDGLSADAGRRVSGGKSADAGRRAAW